MKNKIEESIMRGSRRRKAREEFNTEAIRERDELMRLILPPLLGIVICLICLCGTTWAWFTATSTGDITTIRAAEFSVTVSAKDTSPAENEDATLSPTSTSGRTYIFNIKSVPKVYTFTIFKASENDCTASKGFCLVTVANKNGDSVNTYYTDNISEAYSITVRAGEEGTVTIKPCWGTVTHMNNVISGAKKLDSGGSVEIGDYDAAVAAALAAEQAAEDAALAAEQAEGAALASEQAEETTPSAEEAEETAPSTEQTTEEVAKNVDSNAEGDVNQQPQTPEAVENSDSIQIPDDSTEDTGDMDTSTPS